MNLVILWEDVEDFLVKNSVTLNIGKLGYGKTRRFLCLKGLNGLSKISLDGCSILRNEVVRWFYYILRKQESKSIQSKLSHIEKNCGKELLFLSFVREIEDKVIFLYNFKYVFKFVFISQLQTRIWISLHACFWWYNFLEFSF